MKNTLWRQAFNGQMETIGAVGLLLIGNSLPGHLPKARLMRTTSGRTNYRYVNHQELHCAHTHTHIYKHTQTALANEGTFKYVVVKCNLTSKSITRGPGPANIAIFF